ncbi:MAG: ribosomal protein S12 methylthiotransferase RimO [Rhodomicrobium sp.]|nr:MAG: ribosomal protein S12 methylthiotransferase RimO [Rhodomicrobium sp.]
MSQVHPPKVGFVSLGCPKALVDSERILTKLRSTGYEVAPSYDGADVVVVNTCGFIDSAREESFAAIQEAMNENGRVIVTGCLVGEAAQIREEHPNILAVTGPQQYEAVVSEVQKAAPIDHNPLLDLVPAEGVKLTPRHYAYLKISEGCNHKCQFCIIPSIRGPLQSRPIHKVLREAERLVEAGCEELLVIAQDTSAYGLDVKYKPEPWKNEMVATRFRELCDGLGSMGAWVRLHYVYPYPHVDEVIPMMADGKILPYLDIPFQHASPTVLKAMRRPAHGEKVLDRLETWRNICPDIAVRSTFIVGFPGETDADFEMLLNWLDKAELNRVGCFKYENVEGARSNDLPGHVDEAVKEERWHRFMAKAQEVSQRVLAKRVGRDIEVVVDEVDEEGAIARSQWDAPDIDGCVFLNGETDLAPGDRLQVTVTHSDEYDLWAEPVRN